MWEVIKGSKVSLELSNLHGLLDRRPEEEQGIGSHMAGFYLGSLLLVGDSLALVY